VVHNLNKKMAFKLYVDSCVLVAYYYEFDTKNQHQQTIDCLETIAENHKKVVLVTSDFTFTEFVKVLTQKDGINDEEIYKNLSDMVRQNKIGNKYPFQIIDVEGTEKHYTFNDFFVGLQKTFLDSKLHFQDAIHAQIMMNNKIKRILTFDDKDFNSMPNIKVIHPIEIKRFVEGISIQKGKLKLSGNWRQE